MAGDDATETWYVRARGRVLGPLTWDQLRALRERGQLARFDQVSRDRQVWKAADTLDRLFPKSGGGAFGLGPGAVESGSRRRSRADEVEFLILDDEAGGPVPAADLGGPAASAEESAGWYYADAGTPQGPVGYGELRRLARDGRIGPSTLYWRSGLEQWAAGADLPELHRLWPAGEGPATPPAGPTLPPRERAKTAEPAAAPSPALRLAIAALALNLICGAGNVAAIAVGVIALRQIARSRGTAIEKGLALGGIALGAVGVIGSAMACLWLFGRGTE